MTGMILKGGSIVTPEAVLQKDLLISDGLIHFMDGASGGGLPAGISPRSVKKAGIPVRDIQGKYVVPGFVDIHFHGYRLFEFTIGYYDPETAGFDSSREAYTRGFRMLRGLLPSFGVTGLYVGTFASDIENLERCFRYLREYLKESEKEIPAGPGRGTRLHGGLLEGTFLNPAMSGAQNPELVYEPSIKTFDRIKDQGIIRLANVVPDSGKTSCELIRSLTERGVIVGAGHTDATADQVYDAVEAGLKYIIHFTNGPTGGSYKPFGGGGAVEGILSSDDLMVELICDGYHVNPAYVLDIIARKGVDRVVGITDAIHVSGSDLKEIELEGVTGRVSDDGRYFYVLEKKNTLFSSNLTMNKAFENLLNWQTADSPGIWNRRHAALPLEEAMVRTARMCSTNACRLTGLGEKGFGSIREGYVADLCIMEIRGKPGSFEVQVHAAIIQGETAYTREEKP